MAYLNDWSTYDINDILILISIFLLFFGIVAFLIKKNITTADNFLKLYLFLLIIIFSSFFVYSFINDIEMSQINIMKEKNYHLQSIKEFDSSASIGTQTIKEYHGLKEYDDNKHFASESGYNAINISSTSTNGAVARIIVLYEKVK